ncbi:MAG: tRNA preQ1(34) S-adenosylmethionine ribosyltransferase-isomerase QueA [Candidatus Omnitrophota bacterium]
MQLSDFNYLLPKTLIAQAPLPKRDASRLLVVHRKSGRIEHRHFRDFPDYFQPGDIVVLNDTKVKRVRAVGKRASGSTLEVLFLQKRSPEEYEVLLNPGSRLKPGSRIFLGDHEAVLIGGNGVIRRIRFQGKGIDSWLHQNGLVPLPPYIRRPATEEDASRYQTVYAKKDGAVAAPTAGLHFTKELLRKLEERGILQCVLTLHVGYGTFEPVRCENIREHRMHAEYFEISQGACNLLNRTRQLNRVVAVGTTCCRALETSIKTRALEQEVEKVFHPMKGWTDLFIHPPYPFQGTDALLTNFHLPKTTLLMLVSAFGGIALIRDAYREAIRQRYRFYSYGDAMLIL